MIRRKQKKMPRPKKDPEERVLEAFFGLSANEQDKVLQRLNDVRRWGQPAARKYDRKPKSAAPQPEPSPTEA